MNKVSNAIFIITILWCQPDAQLTTSSDSTSSVFASSFFSWYISANKQRPGYFQTAPYKKITNDSYMFDIDEYRKRITSIDFFSEEYKGKLIAKLSACNREMLKVKWDAEPEAQFNIQACDYLWFDNWLGGQGEDIDGFKILTETVKGDFVEVIRIRFTPSPK